MVGVVVVTIAVEVGGVAHGFAIGFESFSFQEGMATSIEERSVVLGETIEFHIAFMVIRVGLKTGSPPIRWLLGRWVVASSELVSDGEGECGGKESGSSDEKSGSGEHCEDDGLDG